MKYFCWNSFLTFPFLSCSRHALNDVHIVGTVLKDAVQKKRLELIPAEESMEVPLPLNILNIHLFWWHLVWYYTFYLNVCVCDSICLSLLLFLVFFKTQWLPCFTSFLVFIISVDDDRRSSPVCISTQISCESIREVPNRRSPSDTSEWKLVRLHSTAVTFGKAVASAVVGACADLWVWFSISGLDIP